MTTATCLRRGRALVAANGLHKGEMFDPNKGADGPHCTLGAVYRVTADERVRRRAVQALTAVIPDTALSRWNDRPETTTADAVLAFSRAIARVQKRGRAS